MRPDLFFLLLFAAVPALPQERSTDLADGPYWQRASALMEKRRRGEELSAPERDFLEEAKRWRRQLREEKAKRDPSDGTDGDGAQGIRSVVPPASLPAGTSPPKSLEIPSSDSPALPSFYRRPPGEGPFPALVFLHGGLKQMSAEELRRQLTENPVITRLLATGYLAVVSTFRDYEADIQSRQPIDDSLATIRAVANLDFVDPRRIALFGGSGGGNIALELASGAPVRAVVAGEPATVIYTGMLTTGDYGPRLEMMKTPEKYFDEKKRTRTLEKLRSIETPVLILHSDGHDLIRLNRDLLMPMAREVGAPIEFELYPGYGHGFYLGSGPNRWGPGADLEVVETVVEDVLAFLDRSGAGIDR